MDKNETHQKIVEAGSFPVDRSSLISDLDSYEDDDEDLPMPDLTADQIMLWFKRGSVMFERDTRVEDIMERLLNVEIQAKRWDKEDFEGHEGSENHTKRVISLDSEDEADPGSDSHLRN